MVQFNSNKGKKIAGGLAGAAALAAGSQAYGAIVVVAPPADVVSPGGANVSTTGAVWDIDGDAVGDFQFRFRDNISTSWAYSAQVITQATGAGGVSAGADGGYGPYAVKIPAAGLINAGVINSSPPNRAVLGSRYGTTDYGDWAGNSGPGYLGLKFTNASGVHFGWVCLSVTPGTGVAGVGKIQFCGAAFEDAADTPIAAGAVPEPGSLAMLALGAAALVSSRRKKN